MNERSNSESPITNSEISSLYQNLDKPGAASHVDKQLLDMAHAEVSRRRNSKSRLLPFSIAATLILTAGLTTTVVQQLYTDVDETPVPVSSPSEDTLNVEPRIYSQPPSLEGRTPEPAPIEPGQPGTELDRGTTPSQSRPSMRLDRIDPLSDADLEHQAPADPYHDFTADNWITQIQALWLNGDHELARNAYMEFRRRFPNHPLPSDFPVSEASLKN